MKENSKIKKYAISKWIYSLEVFYFLGNLTTVMNQKVHGWNDMCNIFK
jgi:hypothetical protein